MAPVLSLEDAVFLIGLQVQFVSLCLFDDVFIDNFSIR